MSNYYVRTIERAAAPRSRKLREAGTGTAVSGSSASMDTSGLVTLYTDQTITGEKTFANDVIFGGEVSEGVFGSMYLPSTEGPGKYSLYVSTDPVSGETPTAPSGIDEDELWDILGGSGTEVIDLSHIPSIPTSKITGLDTVLAPYATQAWVQQQGYLASVSLATISDLDSGWDALLKAAPSYYSKAEIGSLLSSYYTETEADGRFVGVSNEQTVSGKKTFSSLLTAGGGISSTNADFSGYVSADVLYLPYSGGNKMYSLYVSTGPVSGEQPSEGIGLDEEAMWTALRAQDSSKVIDLSHIPTIPTSKITGLDTALSSYATKSWVTSQNYAVQANDNNLISHPNEFNFIPAGFSNVVWFNFRAKGGTGSISQYIFGRGSTVVGEYADLLAKNFIVDGGAGFIKRMHTDTSNFEAGPIWYNAAGTSHLAAIGYWNTPQKVFINPCYNEVTDVWDDAVGKYNFVVGKNFLTYNTYPILHSGNYASTLDSRYVKKAGDTMTGTLTVPSLYANSQACIYESASHATRLSLNWSGGIARIYAINDSGSGYYDMSLGQTPGNNAALYFDASAARWGIGTTSPAYKLDVAGTLRATGQGSFDTIKITSTSGTSHLIFSRANYNYITAPSGGYISFNTNGVGTGSAVSDLTIHAHQLFPGTTNAVTFGLSTRRWSNVYSVLGNFSGLVTAGSIAVTDKLYIPSPDGNQRYYIKFE